LRPRSRKIRCTRIELDPDHRLIDQDRGNNIWIAGAS
jgi:hypothetical protein